MNSPSRLNRLPSEPSWWLPYANHIPLLGLGLLSSLCTLYVVVQFSPAELELTWLPNVYFPFQIASFLSLFFLASFITLNTRRGYFLAVVVQIAIFLRLQHVELTREVLISLIGIFVIIEVVTSLFFRVIDHANISQKSRSHHRSRHT